MPSHRDVVVLFQRALARRRRTVPQLLAGMEVQAPEAVTDVALQEVSSDVAALVVAALGSRSQADAARVMGVSESLLTRQLQNVDNQHLSLQRLWRLDDAFWREFVLLVIERRQLAVVNRSAIVEFKL
jgi:DNA-binding protein Fis